MYGLPDRFLDKQIILIYLLQTVFTSENVFFSAYCLPLLDVGLHHSSVWRSFSLTTLLGTQHEARLN